MLPLDMAGAPSAARLSVQTALNDGWLAFRRAPWTFVGFCFLWMLLSSAVDHIPSVPGVIASTIVDLWGTIGLIRGGWIALDGNQPRFGDFTSWNTQALWRVFSRRIVLFVLLILISLIVIYLALTASFGADQALVQAQSLVNLGMTADPSDPQNFELWKETLLKFGQTIIQNPAAILILLIGWVVGLYFQVNQLFLDFIALLEGPNPFAAIRRGIVVVQGQWVQVLGLMLVQVVVLLIGVLACGIGLLAAFPVTICMSAAGYRQLFGSVDHKGFFKGH
tara:strand:- start:95 stop:931 length:837 start_codon:yes stop_codon:yes gene_type:complete